MPRRRVRWKSWFDNGLKAHWSTSSYLPETLRRPRKVAWWWFSSSDCVGATTSRAARKHRRVDKASRQWKVHPALSAGPKIFALCSRCRANSKVWCSSDWKLCRDRSLWRFHYTLGKSSVGLVSTHLYENAIPWCSGMCSIRLLSVRRW